MNFIEKEQKLKTNADHEFILFSVPLQGVWRTVLAHLVVLGESHPLINYPPYSGKYNQNCHKTLGKMVSKVSILNSETKYIFITLVN